jgi:hypothetical protein
MAGEPAMEVRLTRVEDRLTGVEGRLTGVERKVDRLEQKVDGFAQARRDRLEDRQMFLDLLGNHEGRVPS